MNASGLSPCPSLELASRLRGCWLGKSIGGTLGLPAEGEAGRLHFTFYDPVPTAAPPNDDLELQLVWLHLVENTRASLTRRDFARAWLNHIHYMWDEYGRCRWNLRRGVPPENAGTFENPFQSGMGSPIRSEIWACLFPGDPDSAAHYAALDASLDHGTEGIAGEVFFAVMQSLVADDVKIGEAIGLALEYIPSSCETALAIACVMKEHQDGKPVWECRENLLAAHGNENFTHAPLNVALTVWALVYGAEDFETSILLAVNGGYDTDCTAATVGATLGLAQGTRGIPARWSEPIGENIFVGPGILGISAPKTLQELTGRTAALIGKLEPRKWNGSVWTAKIPAMHSAPLPGTIQLMTPGKTLSIPWANGELPMEIKKAGGGSWTWEVADNHPRTIMCLARGGARLFVNGKLVIDCPPNLPYVPAPHRCPAAARERISPGAGTHEVRLELDSSAPGQEACVLLAYTNMHLCPWTAQELPHRAELPDSRHTTA